MFPFAVTIFLSAYLLFQIQPLLGKFLLPWFGGTPAVWTTCMLFFQLVLVLGYAYGHWLARCGPPRMRRWFHPILLLLTCSSIFFLAILWGRPLLPSTSWWPMLDEMPTAKILALLSAGIGLPYLMLASTSPLVQHWFGRCFPGRSPYRLYALSNFASMLALITYPVAVEPFLSLSLQARIWSVGFFLFALLCSYCCRKAFQASHRFEELKDSVPAGCLHEPGEMSEGSPSTGRRFAWLGLAACASVLLLSVTNQICQEIAVIPFLWVLPLSIYLVSLIICFDNERWYRRNPFMFGLLISVWLVVFALRAGIEIHVFWQILFYSLMLFFASMVCHGELVRRKPGTRHLTLFYLWVAMGGACGGLFVSLMAPRLFPGYWELHLGVWMVSFTAVLVYCLDRSSWVYLRMCWPAFLILLLSGWVALAVFHEDFDDAPFRTLWKIPTTWPAGMLVLFLLVLWGLGWLKKMGRGGNYSWLNIRCMIVSLLILAGLLMDQIHSSMDYAKVAIRNFYGVLMVLEENANDPVEHLLRLRHGRITHGLQYQAPDRRGLLTTYYNATSGLGLAFQKQRRERLANDFAGGLRVGMLGLGVGTIAGFTSSVDVLRIYEINPDVVFLSSSLQPTFTYLRDSGARKEIVLGDARISMEREMEQNSPQQLDILAIDAFSSDSIPVHLLTREALAVYLYHLNSRGIIAIHVSNRYLDLQPVIWALAEEYHLAATLVMARKEGINWRSDWFLLSRDLGLLKDPMLEKAGQLPPPKSQLDRLWTDNFSNLFHCLKWKN